VRWGYATEAKIHECLQLQKKTQKRLDQILVEQGLISRAVVDDEAQRLMEQVVFSTLSWPEAEARFEPCDRIPDLDVALSISVTRVIIEAIRRIPEEERFLELLGDLSAIPARVESGSGETDLLRLPEEAARMLSRIDGTKDARGLLDPTARMADAKILYALVFCGLVEMRPPRRPQEARKRRLAAAEQLAARGRHWNLVKDTYRRIDWLSHYDLLGISMSATPEEIEEAYRSRARLFDPQLDLRPDLKDCARELTVVFERLRIAHEILTTASSRESYDRKIQDTAAALWRANEDAIGPEGKVTDSTKVRASIARENYQRARQLIADLDYFPAIQLLEEAVNFSPTNLDYRCWLGRALSKNRLRREEAIEHLQEVVRLDPTRADCHAALAEVLLEHGRPEEAAIHARRAVEIDPEEPSYLALEARARKGPETPPSG